MRNLIFNHKKISLWLYFAPCYTNTISTGNVIQEEVRGEDGRPGGAGDLNYKGLFFMKHDFYLLLTLGSSSAGDETAGDVQSRVLRAGVLLSLLSLGRPVERRQENRDYFGEVNSELKQPAHTMPKVSLTAPGTAGCLDRVWALECGSAIHRTFITWGS